MSRYRAMVAEVATGIIRRADLPEMRFLNGEPGQNSRVFESEDLALEFKDDVLAKHSDLEVAVRPEHAVAAVIGFIGRKVRSSK